MATTQTTVSYRRNRDYSKQFNWTYELNKDLFKCYTDAKNEPGRGYMKRMKNAWDLLHPEFSHFNEKYLRQQASNIIQKGYIRETQTVANNNENIEVNNEEIITVNDNNIDPQLAVNDLPQEVDDQINNPIQPNDEQRVFDINNNELYQTLRESFTANYQLFNSIEKERILTTFVRRKPAKEKINIVNEIANEFLMNIKQNREVTFEDINCLIYTSAVTAKGDTNNQRKERTEPKWLTSLQNKIDSIRRNIAHIELILKCKETNTFSRKQLKICKRLRKKFGNTKKGNLVYRQKLLKNELKATSTKLKYQRKVSERKRINRLFTQNPKSVYRSFKESANEVKDPPTKTQIENFWKGIWGTEGKFNADAEWLQTLEDEYCTDVQNNTNCDITRDTMRKAISKLQDSKSPGNDLIIGYWYKHLTFFDNDLSRLFNNALNGVTQIPSWMAKAETTLLSKNRETKLPKNYRPIALQNIMLKLYTSCINQFVQHHCESNNIITTEQAGGKKDVWGCLEQLLINKTVMDEAKHYRRSLVTMWLDYQKAFDSVPHQWLIKALQLAKLPQVIISALEHLITKWSTNVHLQTTETTIISDEIKYNRGIFQGDSLSVILFILCLNPLSFLLNKLVGYKMGPNGNRTQNITNLFFVDDLKLFATNLTQMKSLLNVVTKFSNDIDMKFGLTKCAYLRIDKGKIVTSKEPIVMNNVAIDPVKEGDSYKYLGQDENLGYVGPLNKERVVKEYMKRVRKIWESELSGFHKHIAHNAYAVPVIIPTFGLLDWTKDEIEQIDIKTRKTLCMIGSFHRNSDVDRLYVQRKKGGRGLKSIQIAYETKIISIRQHITQNVKQNKYIECARANEEGKLVRVARELLQQAGITDDPNASPRTMSQRYLQRVLKTKFETFENKQLHGYVQRKISSDEKVDQNTSKEWLTNRFTSSHFEAYACAIQEGEIGTKDLIYRRSRKNNVPVKHDNKCRLCKSQVEDIAHVISSCPKMSSRYYLPMRHDIIAKYVYEKVRRDHNKECNIKYDADEFIVSDGDHEYWWNVSVKTPAGVPHNKPDLIMWNCSTKNCYVIEFSCPNDMNVSKKVQEKEDHYGPLIRAMNIMYPDYKFVFVPIVVGALGTVPKELFGNIELLGFSENESKQMIRFLQQKSIIGTVKITKTFLSFKI